MMFTAITEGRFRGHPTCYLKEQGKTSNIVTDFGDKVELGLALPSLISYGSDDLSALINPFALFGLAQQELARSLALLGLERSLMASPERGC